MFELKGKNIGGVRPLIMGILNLTPDSFFPASRISDHMQLLQTAERMIACGADMLDLGAMSSRPGAAIITETEERNRLLPALRAIAHHFPQTILSVDTFRSTIANEALTMGADLINDISGGEFDPQMPALIGSQNVPYVLMHMHRNPEQMQESPLGEEAFDVVRQFFKRQTALFEAHGAHRLICDPGFGFGKTLAANYQLLAQLDELVPPSYPLLVGLSRKSMIYKLLETNPEQALNGTTALNMAALLKGAAILRVHDVKEAKETVELYLQITVMTHQP